MGTRASIAARNYFTAHPRDAMVATRVPTLLKAAIASPFLLVLLAASLCPAQVKPGGFAVFSRVETATLPTGLDLTIICTKPVAPGFTQLKDPERLVIDLPDTLVGNHPQSVPLTGPDVRTMRINQFQKDPPITRIVLDLLGERDYSYEPKGVSFVVHLRSAQPTPANPAQTAATVAGKIGIGLPQAPAKVALVTGNVPPGNAVAGSKVSPGSAITAGGDTAILKLERGGEIRVCPGTTASITPSANGRSLMTGMSEGAVELHYPLGADSDTVLTPDFRILLPGPGNFHLAISADTKGNTCVRALQGNTSSAVVSELMGDGTYQVKPGEQVVFRSGRLSHSDANVPMECGCPPPRQPQPVASGAGASSAADADHSRTLAMPSDGSALPPVTSALPVPATAGTPQVVVDAPFVFRASDLPPEISKQVAQLRAGRAVQAAPALVIAPPHKGKRVKTKKEKVPAKLPTVAEPPNPAPAPKPEAVPASPPPTFLGKVKSFFRSIFK
jgi:AMIN domain